MVNTYKLDAIRRFPNGTITSPPSTTHNLTNRPFNATIGSEEEENTAIQQPKIKELIITKINESLEFIIGNQAFQTILNIEDSNLNSISEKFKKLISDIKEKKPIQIKDFFKIINYTSEPQIIEKERQIIEEIKMDLSSLLVSNLLINE